MYPPARSNRIKAMSIGFHGVALLALGLLALVLRIPNHQIVPAFTDERNDIAQALRIVRGEDLPLTNDPSYIGALWNYLLAAAFWIGGESLLVPRTVVLVLGVVGVLAAYPLGRAWGGRPGGVLAALLLATSAGHIAFTSRIAWSHSLTPLFVTVGVWALVGAVRRADTVPAARLMLAGVSWGLAFQTHPTALALLPGALAYVVVQRRSLLTSRWLFLAALAFLVVNLNLLAYNLMTGFESVSRGIEQAGQYAEAEPLTGWLYLERLGLLLLGLFQSLGGAVDLETGPAELLLDPALWPIAALAVAGVIWQWRRDNPLPALLLLSTVAILPLINGKYNLVPNGRYLAPLLPVLYAAVAALVVDGLRSISRVGVRWTQRPTLARAVAVGGIAVLTAFLTLHPLVYLRDYYADVSEVGWTNAPIFAALNEVDEYPAPDAPVILDRSLNVHHSGWGNGTPRDAFELGLTISRTPYRVADLRNEDNTGRLLAPAGRCRDQLVILAPREDQEENVEVVERLGLLPLPGVALGGFNWETAYPVYVLPRALTAPRTC
jgi:4-amino-4-deoxy-L-arabinose transferase-like glycosyltransferase